MSLLSTTWSYLKLPEEITPFERDYVKRINKVALGFLVANIPTIALVAWLCGTGVGSSLLLTSLALVGPLIAWRWLENPRHLAMVFGFTSMCMGGLLVHFGQGPMQIEMHFYFFVVLALLSVYGNPMVVLVSAVTVALHHLILYLVLPSSLFNYDASLWVVLVHALFVVLESAAACFLARNFFDDVIGLEKIVQERTQALDARNRDMRLVLDNVHQGFVTISMDGTMASEHSSIMDRWFGAMEEPMTFQQLLERADQGVAEWFTLSLEELREGFMPLEMLLDQMPKRVEIGGKTMRMNFTPIADAEGNTHQLLVMISDITAMLERERMEAERGEIVQAFERIIKDKAGFLDFFHEAQAQIRWLVHPDEGEVDMVLFKRTLHTLKGNCGIYGLQTLAGICHQLETSMAESGVAPSQEEMSRLEERWRELCDSLSVMLDHGEDAAVELDDDEYEGILRDVVRGASHQVLAERIRAWKLEPTGRILHRLREQAQALALRLEKGEVQVQVEDHDLRIDPKRWRNFWQACVHVLRNAIDHGLEPPQERQDAGKPAVGLVSLRTYLEENNFVVEIADDGRGINWDHISAIAAERGLVVEDDADLKNVLFMDGVSTRQEASEFSGRGVGMAAVLQACEELDGDIDIITHPNQGTRMQFRFPQEAMAS